MRDFCFKINTGKLVLNQIFFMIWVTHMTENGPNDCDFSTTEIYFKSMPRFNTTHRSKIYLPKELIIGTYSL